MFIMGNIRLFLLWVFVVYFKGSFVFVRLIDFLNSEFLIRKLKFNYSLFVYFILFE